MPSSLFAVIILNLEAVELNVLLGRGADKRESEKGQKKWRGEETKKKYIISLLFRKKKK